MTVMMYDVLRQLLTGDVSVKELSGPVGIVYAVNETAKSGIMYVVYLAALLSLNLAIINMLPLPALDGGRLLFLVIRKITGRRVTDEMEGRIHFIGIMLLMLLMVYVTFNDVISSSSRYSSRRMRSQKRRQSKNRSCAETSGSGAMLPSRYSP